MSVFRLPDVLFLTNIDSTSAIVDARKGTVSLLVDKYFLEDIA